MLRVIVQCHRPVQFSDTQKVLLMTNDEVCAIHRLLQKTRFMENMFDQILSIKVYILITHNLAIIYMKQMVIDLI